MSTARDRPPEEASEDTSFARGLRILLTVADRGSIRAEQLSTLLDTPQSTVYRYLKTLAEFGFVERDGSAYRLGPRLLIGGTSVTAAALVRAAGPVLEVLSAQTGETAALLRRVGTSAVCLASVAPERPLRVAIESGEVRPLHLGAGPRALLAFAPPEVLEEVLAGPDVNGFAEPLPDPAALREALAEIAAAGIARGDGDVDPGVVALAAPVLLADGIAAAVVIAGPASRCDDAWRRKTARRLPEAVAAIVAALDAPR